MKASKYETRGEFLFATDGKGFNASLVSRAFVASLGPGGVVVKVGAHSIGFPMAWLDGEPKRILAALTGIGGEPSSYPSTGRHVVACIKQQLDTGRGTQLEAQ